MQYIVPHTYKISNCSQASQQTYFGRVRDQPALPAAEANFGCQYSTAFALISSNRNRGSFVSEELNH